MKIKDLPKIERPREKLIAKGASALKKVELLAILLRTGIKNKNVIQVAEDVLESYGGKKFFDASYKELRNIHGVGSTKAAQILAAIELGKRLYREKIGKEVYIHTPKDVLKEVDYLKENKRENFLLLCLDARSKLIYKETISIGTLNASLVHPREVFEPAIRNYAAQIIVVHNHPSGNTEPSEDDLVITKRLIEAGKILGVDLFDHVIIGEDQPFSFRDRNLL